MSGCFDIAGQAAESSDTRPATAAPGKRSRTAALPAIQRRSAAPAEVAAAASRPGDLAAQLADLDDPFGLHLPVQAKGELTGDAIHGAAAGGLTGPASPLPHLDTIQRAFGGHDVSHVKAHVGGEAATASAAMGAQAYATGDHVAFAATPSLHLAAHEAAHVVQQRAGVSLKSGVGQTGDAYEQHADAVADEVVAGRSAASLLDGFTSGGATGSASTVQRKGAEAGQVAGNAKELAKDTVGLTRALTDLEHAEVEARNVLARWRAGKLKTAAALAAVATTIRGTYTAMHAFDEAHDVTALDGQWRAKARAALDSIARTALTIIPEPVHLAPIPGTNLVMPIATPVAAEDAARADELRSVLSTLAVLGEAVEWTLPRTSAQALRSLQTHEMCPTDARDEGLAGCALADSERVELRTNVRVDAINALDAFRRACEPHHARLDKMIAREVAMRELVIGTFVDKIGASLVAEAAAAAAVIDPITAETTSGKYDKATAFAHTLGQKVAKAAGAAFAGPAAGEGTKGMLDALVEAMRAQLTEAVDGVKALSDKELRLTANAMYRQTKPEVYAAPLKQLVDAYQVQIDPIGNGVGGETRARLTLPPGSYFTYTAVRIAIPSGPRLAQVAHEANTTPTDGATKGRTDHRYIFVRWIDAQFDAVVADAPTLPLDQVEGLSLGDMVATVTGPQP